jgi:hypothetical protein
MERLNTIARLQIKLAAFAQSARDAALPPAQRALAAAVAQDQRRALRALGAAA